MLEWELERLLMCSAPSTRDLHVLTVNQWPRPARTQASALTERGRLRGPRPASPCRGLGRHLLWAPRAARAVGRAVAQWDWGDRSFNLARGPVAIPVKA
jgi:hypothetical protein